MWRVTSDIEAIDTAMELAAEAVRKIDEGIDGGADREMLLEKAQARLAVIETLLRGEVTVNDALSDLNGQPHAW